MKAIMISIKPKWCALEMNGDKTTEVRKNKALANAIQKLIVKYGYADIYVYCSKDNKKHLYPVALLDKHNKVFKRRYKEDDIDNRTNYLNGKVIFKFRCYKVVPIVMQMGASYGYGNNGYIGYGHCEKDNFKFMFDMEKETCLEHNEELCKYLNNGKNFADIYINKLKANDGYAIHISDLEIFDRPKELMEFKIKGFERIKVMGSPYGDLDSVAYHYEKKPILKPLTKAPQNFCYVEVEE